MKRRIKKIKGTAERPRLSVYRSLRHIHAQVINDHSGLTLASVSTLDKEVGKGSKGTGNKAAAKLAGGVLAKRAASAGVLQVVFDRGSARYHGRVKDFADGARAGGLKF